VNNTHRPATLSTITSADLDLPSVLNLLWARREIIMGVMLSCTIIAIVMLLQQKSLYTAETTLMLDTRQMQVTDFQAVMSGLKIDEGTVRSEIAILNSRAMAYRVAKSLNLLEDAEFNPLLNKTPHPPATFFHRLLSSIGIGARDTEANSARVESVVTKKLLAGFSVDNDGKSYAITIGFTSENPEKAARIANEWANQYLTDQLEVKFDATERANAWLSKRLEELKEKITIADNAVAAAREKGNIIEDKDGQTLTSKQLIDLNTQLVLAQTERAQAEARLRQARQLVSKKGGFESVSQVVASQLIQKLREQEADLVRQEADLTSRYGERHPDLINIRNQIRDLRGKITEEVERIISSLANEVEVARARENTLQDNIRKVEGKVAVNSRVQIQISQLVRDAEANHLLYKSFLERFKQTFSRDNFQQADARVIAKADVPINPSKPKKKLIVLVVIFLSSILGIFIVFLLELLSNTFRTPLEVEKILGLKTLAMVPQLNKTNAKRLLAHLRENITAPYAESIRAILTTLQFQDKDNKGVKTILVTSSEPNEGKTFFSLSLANVAALGGKKVLLIDADLRRPRIAQMLNVSPEKGLSDYLNGTASIKEIVYKDVNMQTEYCLSHGKVAVPQNALGAVEMKKLIEMARDYYDYVIIDSPPVLAVSDALVLAPQVDYMLYAVRYDRTSRKTVCSAMRSLSNLELPISVVLTAVNVARHARYGYGDNAAYYGKYGDYYAIKPS
jgi:succinoglycan biosynthesis transport protein ExoP